VLLFTAWLGPLATAIVPFDGVPLAWRIGSAAVVQLLIAIAMLLATRRSKGADSDATSGGA
jgi:uncharacterized membrane protein (DUF2068 family)